MPAVDPAAASETTFHVCVLTPERRVFDGPVECLRVVGVAGVMEVYAGHEPFMSPLTIDMAVLTPPHEGELVTVALHGGFLDVTGRGEAVILADAAELATEIDLARVEEARVRAEERLALVKARSTGDPSDGLDIDRARLALMRALTRQGAAERATSPGRGARE